LKKSWLRSIPNLKGRAKSLESRPRVGKDGGKEGKEDGR